MTPAASSSSAAATPTMAIPQFRSCRVRTVSDNGPPLGLVRLRRRRSVSSNSTDTTVSSSRRSSFLSSDDRRSSASSLLSEDQAPSSEDDGTGDFERQCSSRLVAPALPSAPYPVDPYHFHCFRAQTSSALVMEITQALNQCDVEYSFQPWKCKFKCVKYVHYSLVEFIVRVYTTQHGVLLVEFQRRSGSALIWDGLYSVLYHKLAQWVDPQASACPQSGGQKKVLVVTADSSASTPSSSQLSPQVWRTFGANPNRESSGLEAMEIMVTSKYIDAQREGCAGLAMLTEDEQGARLAVKQELLEPLVTAAGSEDMEMARCAVSALANIARALVSYPNPAVSMDHLTRAVQIVTGLLEKSSDTTQRSLELLRECARSLICFSKLCPKAVQQFNGGSLLLQHASHRDSVLSKHCLDAMAALQPFLQA